MPPEEFVGHYWAVDLPGLTEPGADEILSFAGQAGVASFGAIKLDPMRFLTLHLDDESVEALAAILALVVDDPRRSNAGVLASIQEILEEWLVDRRRARGSTDEESDLV